LLRTRKFRNAARKLMLGMKLDKVIGDDIDNRKTKNFKGVDEKTAVEEKEHILPLSGESILWHFYDLFIYGFTLFFIYRITISLSPVYISEYYTSFFAWMFTELLYVLDIILNFIRVKRGNLSSAQRTLCYVFKSYIM
jgi:hypothetical protein